jgi:hypothetical protein
MGSDPYSSLSETIINKVGERPSPEKRFEKRKIQGQVFNGGIGTIYLALLAQFGGKGDR